MLNFCLTANSSNWDRVCTQLQSHIVCVFLRSRRTSHSIPWFSQWTSLRESVKQWINGKLRMSLWVVLIMTMLQIIMLTAVDDLVWNHMSCFAHTLQLAVNKGLDNTTIFRVSAVARKLVGHFEHSAAAVTELKQKQQQLSVPQHHLLQDVSTGGIPPYSCFKDLWNKDGQFSLFLLMSRAHNTNTSI